MLDPNLAAGVGRIVAARRAGASLDGLPDACRPRTLAEGYAMQRAAIAQWADAQAGWKIGATAKSVQDLFGVTEPIYGPVFAATVHRAPARLPAKAFQHLMIEAEFALAFGAELKARDRAYRREEILDAVATVMPALEIVSPRFARLPADEAPLLIADFCANGGAVLGPPCADWRRLDFPAHEVALTIGGKLRQRGTGAVALGNPLNALEWLVNALCSRGIGLAAGQFVLTGTVTGIHAPLPGESACADFGALGEVRVIFEP